MTLVEAAAGDCHQRLCSSGIMLETRSWLFESLGHRLPRTTHAQICPNKKSCKAMYQLTAVHTARDATVRSDIMSRSRPEGAGVDSGTPDPAVCGPVKCTLHLNLTLCEARRPSCISLRQQLAAQHLHTLSLWPNVPQIQRHMVAYVLT